MADFTKLIEQANAAEQSPEETMTSPVTLAKNRKLESLDDRRTETAKSKRQTLDPVETDPRTVPAFESSAEEPWTNFTTRLRSGTKKRLHQLCLERQLSDTAPWGQQELVEEAVVAVINKYLREAVAS